MDNKVSQTPNRVDNIKKHKSENHYLKKRPPQKFELGKEIIYVSSKSNIKVIELN